MRFLEDQILKLALCGVALAPFATAQHAKRLPRSVDGAKWWITIDGQIGHKSNRNTHVPTGVEYLGGGYEDGEEVVLFGVSKGAGVIERWGKRGDELVRLSEVRILGRDFVGMAHEPRRGCLWVLDAEKCEVLCAAWDGSGPFPEQFAVWANAQQVPHLKNSRDCSLFWRCRYPEGLLLRDETGFAETIVIDGRPPNHTLYRDQGMSIVRCCVPLLGTLKDGATSVVVFGEPGAEFEIVEVADKKKTIGRGVIPRNRASVDVRLQTPLVIGRPYELHDRITSECWSAVCVRRYGASEVHSDGRAVDPLAHPDGSRVGSQAVVTASLSPQRRGFVPGMDAMRNREGVWAIAVSSPGREDPVAWQQGRALLDTDVYLPAKSAADGDGLVFQVVLPTFDGADIEGAVVLVQLLIPDGELFRRSEIIGFRVAGITKSPTHREAAMIQNAAGAWLQRVIALPGVVHSEVGVRELRAKLDK